MDEGSPGATDKEEGFFDDVGSIGTLVLLLLLLLAVVVVVVVVVVVDANRLCAPPLEFARVVSPLLVDAAAVVVVDDDARVAMAGSSGE